MADLVFKDGDLVFKDGDLVWKEDSTPSPTPSDVVFQDSDVQFANGDVVWSGSSLVSIALVPINPVVPFGGSQQFIVMGTFDSGAVVDITSICTFDSSNVDTVTVTATGLATVANQ